MAVNLSPIGGAAAQFFDSNGNPLSGGKIYTYAAGTTTPQATYTSVGGGTPHANPIILDAAGRVPGGEIWLTDGLSYKFVLQTSANVLIGTYDNIFLVSGDAGQINYTAPFTNSVTYSLENKLAQTVSVKDFGAVGNGVADDTVAIQNAVNAVAATGGAVYFPVPGIYKITSQINIVSDYQVTLYSEMGPGLGFGSTPPSSYISVAAPISGAVFDVSTEGGCLRRLWFRDPTSSVGGSQGTNAVNAAVKLTLFTMGTVDSCSFDGINGSAIEVNSCVRGHIVRPHVRDCGTVSRPAIWLNPSAFNVGQMVIDGGHLEVCRGVPIKIENTNCADTKIISCQFETYPTLAGAQHYFIHDLGQRTTIVGCGFNRSGETQLLLGGVRGRVSACHFALGGASNTQIILTGVYYAVSGCTLVGDTLATGTAIDDQGGSNVFSGNTCYFGGNVKLGTRSTWSGGGLYNLNTTESYAIVAGTNAVVSGTIISNCPVSGGIRLTSGAVASGNKVTLNAGIGIRCESSTAVVMGNSVVSNTGGELSFTGYPRGYSPNANSILSSETPPLQNSAVVDPTNLANGASVSGNITVTGAAVGDVAIVQFPALSSAVAVSGIQVSGSVTASGVVRYSITNNSGGSVDLDSGTLVVKVFKQ